MGIVYSKDDEQRMNFSVKRKKSLNVVRSGAVNFFGSGSTTLVRAENSPRLPPENADITTLIAVGQFLIKFGITRFQVCKK